MINKSQNENIVNISLRNIAKGTGIFIIGTIIGTILGFVGRIIIVRYSSQSEYGLFSLALVLTNFFIMISLLGLGGGAARYIAYFRGKKEEGKIRSVVSLVIKISLFSSIFLSLVLFLLSEIISINIFHTAELITPLKIFSIVIPFSVLETILISIYRGFNRVGPKVYFQDILRNILFVLLLLGIISLEISFVGFLYSYLASFAISCIALIIYTIKKSPLPTFYAQGNFNRSQLRKKLLLFSIPLLMVSTLNMVINWTDTLMLGYFKTPDIVGLYNGAVPLVQIIQTVLLSAAFIYVPIASGLYSKKLITELGRTYQVLTKWIFSLTLPIGLIFIVFPEAILNFLFGLEYIQAASALRILSLGFMFHIFLGLNGNSLVAMGRTRFLMFTSLFGALANVILNIALIPYFGIVGAAIASLLSYCLVNIFNSIKLYRLAKIHPFTKNYVKPIIISIFLLAFVYFFSSFLIIEFWMLPIILIIFLFMYGFLLILTKSFDKEDIELILNIERITGLNLKKIKKILRRFV